MDLQFEFSVCAPPLEEGAAGGKEDFDVSPSFVSRFSSPYFRASCQTTTLRMTNFSTLDLPELRDSV